MPAKNRHSDGVAFIFNQKTLTFMERDPTPPKVMSPQQVRLRNMTSHTQPFVRVRCCETHTRTRAHMHTHARAHTHT